VIVLLIGSAILRLCVLVCHAWLLWTTERSQVHALTCCCCWASDFTRSTSIIDRSCIIERSQVHPLYQRRQRLLLLFVVVSSVHHRLKGNSREKARSQLNIKKVHQQSWKKDLYVLITTSGKASPAPQNSRALLYLSSLFVRVRWVTCLFIACVRFCTNENRRKCAG
jgi:hypothetical protein